jgi:hypothetical protein
MDCGLALWFLSVVQGAEFETVAHDSGEVLNCAANGTCADTSRWHKRETGFRVHRVLPME